MDGVEMEPLLLYKWQIKNWCCKISAYFLMQLIWKVGLLRLCEMSSLQFIGWQDPKWHKAFMWCP